MTLDQRTRRLTISLFLFTTIGMQASVLISQVTDTPFRGWYWPFIDYPMYSEAHFEGEYVNVWDPVFLRLDDGTEVEVTAEDLGFDFWNFELLGNALKQGDENAVDLLLDLHPASTQVTEIILYHYPVIVTRDGPREVPLERLKSIPVAKR